MKSTISALEKHRAVPIRTYYQGKEVNAQTNVAIGLSLEEFF
jgi:hypothetical protein